MFRNRIFTHCLMIEKCLFDVRSGMQSGVDYGALEAALHRGVNIRGWIPKGRLSRIVIPTKYDLFLKEMTDTDFPELHGVTDPLLLYRARTEQNAKESDGTLVIIQRIKELCGGTQYTIDMAHKHHKPLYLLDLSKEHVLDELEQWLITHRIADLNIGGPNEEKSPGAYQAAYNVVTRLLMRPGLFMQKDKEQPLSCSYRR